MKPPANETHLRLRDKLLGLCESPIPGEAAAAKHKLERLLARYEFPETETTENDLFGNVRCKVSKGKARQLFNFEVVDTDIAGFARWAIENRFAVKTLIRNEADWKSSVWVEANVKAVEDLKRISDTIRTQFSTLWHSLRTSAEVDEGDRRPFMLGLYDGMMDDPRQPGQLLPSRVIPSRKKKPKKKSAAGTPGLTAHPYSLALDLGRKIRVSATISETTEALKNAIAGMIPQKAN